MKVTTGIPFSADSSEPTLRRDDAPVSDSSDPSEIIVALATERRRIDEDAAALQEREENLREYEARLRTLQNEMDARSAGPRSSAPFSSTPFPGRSGTPFPGDAALDAAWQKLHRARELCEAEQAHLRDDRIAMRAFELELRQREEAVTAREARVAEQERLLAAAAPRPSEAVADSEQPPSTFKRFTRMPFLMAENVLRGKNGKGAEKTGE